MPLRERKTDATPPMCILATFGPPPVAPAQHSNDTREHSDTARFSHAVFEHMDALLTDGNERTALAAARDEVR